MFWLAASLLCLGGGFSGKVQANSAPPVEVVTAWKQIQPSVIVVSVGGHARGTAALVAAQGYFITGNSVVNGAKTLVGQFCDGRTITLFPLTVDGPTQLALLKTYDALGNCKPVELYAPKGEQIDYEHPKFVIAALPSGPMGAELVSTRNLAVLRSARTISLLSEIHFEGPGVGVGGSPIFTSDGELVGVLQAALPQTSRNPFRALTARGHFERSEHLSLEAPQYGPGGQTVAYSPAPVVMARVLRGFLSPKHAVLRPAIGVLCRDAQGGGAYVDAVLDDSPAAQAGIKEGDVILNIEGTPIRRQVDFASVMLQQIVGSDIHLTVRRERRLMNFSVRVGM